MSAEQMQRGHSTAMGMMGGPLPSGLGITNTSMQISPDKVPDGAAPLGAFGSPTFG